MSQETIDYLLSLNEQDAIQIIAKAKQEAGQEGCFWKQTSSFHAYNEAIEAIRELCRKGGYRISTSTLQFVYYTNKLDYKGVCLFTGMGRYEGTM